MSKVETAIGSLNAANLKLKQARTDATMALYGAGTATVEEGVKVGAGAFTTASIDGKDKLVVAVRRDNGAYGVTLIAPTSVAGLLLRSIPVAAKAERAA